MITDLAAPMKPLVERVVSEDVGLVHSLEDGMARWDHPRLVPAFTALCDTGPVLGATLLAHPGGMADSLQAARHAATGEAVERYSASHVPRSRLRVARRSELDPAPCAPPDWLPGADRDVALPWLPSTRLRATGPGTAAWVAAHRALLVLEDPHLPAARPTSSGLACHDDPWRALCSGLYELIERDAFMLTWLRRLPVTPVRGPMRWRTAGGAWIDFDRAVERYRLVVLPSVSGVPVVLAMALGAEGQPAVAVGAAADLDLTQACRRALVEAFQTFHWGLHLLAEGADTRDRPLAQFDDFAVHVAHYLPPERLGAFDWLLEPEAAALPLDLSQLADPQPPEASVREVVRRLDAAGFDSFATDVTAPDVREAGLWVVRASVPGLYPLHVGQEPRPDLPRLHADEPVNPDPHPFP